MSITLLNIVNNSLRKKTRQLWNPQFNLKFQNINNHNLNHYKMLTQTALPASRLACSPTKSKKWILKRKRMKRGNQRIKLMMKGMVHHPIQDHVHLLTKKKKKEKDIKKYSWFHNVNWSKKRKQWKIDTFWKAVVKVSLVFRNYLSLKNHEMYLVCQ